MVEGSGTTPPKGSGQRGGGRIPIDSKTRSRVRKLAREGRSRNSIAKLVGISQPSVTRICAEARPPITFDRSATKTATEAIVIDLKAKRAELAIDLLVGDVAHIRSMITGKVTRTSWSVTTGVVEYETPATANELKDLAIAAGILIDKHLVLIKTDSDDRDLPAVDQWLDAMMRGGAA